VHTDGSWRNKGALDRRRCGEAGIDLVDHSDLANMDYVGCANIYCVKY